MVSFENSVMYEIDTKRVNQVIQSQVANVYKNYEELYNATIISKSDEKTKDSNTLSSNHMVKIDDNIYLNGDVFLRTPQGITFKSEDLHYNLKSKVAISKSDFEAYDKENKLRGSSLYFDGTNNNIKANNTQFKIDLGNKDNNEAK